ncbi:MAG: 16S rRNA (uracil(1498)-N(3))-methyltransferase [Chloroflexi bacterium]|nr:16S rRNA (uracil(1498)-N(3))-methyltransferase [Chloroflexota bacterium]
MPWSHAKHRFFVPAGSRSGDRVSFSPEQAHQMGRVLRLSEGDVVVALDGSGQEWLVRLERVAGATAQGGVVDARPAWGEPTTHVTLYQALVPREKLELVLQKGTEIGVSAFVPVATERSLARGPLSPERLERWRAIVREAAEQARRGRVPELAQALPLPQALAAADRAALGLFAWERSARPLAEVLHAGRPLARAVHLWVGPEGGFSEAEARQAEAAGLVSVSLGPRILRTETAGLVLAALVLFEAGDLRPVLSAEC